MTLYVYLQIGLALGLCRGLVEMVEYLVDWYQVRHIVHPQASIEEFAWLVLSALLFMPLLLTFFWPLWVWHKFSEARS